MPRNGAAFAGIHGRGLSETRGLLRPACVVSGGSAISSPSIDWAIDGMADFNGDGKPDICWRNCTTGVNYLWYMDGITPAGGAELQTVSDPGWHLEQ